MIKSIQNSALFLCFIAVLVFCSCEPEYDTPPVQTIPEGQLIDITTLKGMYNGVDLPITSDMSLYGVITTDESSGNFYKEAYIEDAGGAIRLRLLASGGLYIGDSVRVYLKETVISEYNGLLQLDNVDVDKNIIKQATGVDASPTVYTLDQVSAGLQSRLIKIENVEFSSASLGMTWADPINEYSVNHTLEDCNNNTVLVRSSGYSNFAGDVIPSGNGSIIGIVSVFGSDVQLIIRTPAELTMDGTNCSAGGGGPCLPSTGMNADFANHTIGSSIIEQCWKAGIITGTNNWLCQNASSNQVAEAAGNNSSASEMWMTTPEIQSGGNDVLTFLSAQQNQLTSTLTVMVSTDFDGTNYSGATWTAVTATVAQSTDGDNTLVPSGNVDLTTALGAGYSGTYRVAFIANMASNQFSLYQVDNVVITQ